MNAPNWNGEPGACRYDRDREDLDTRPDPDPTKQHQRKNNAQ